MSPNLYIKNVTTVVLFCYQVLLVSGDRCLFTLSNGALEYKYCANGCCEDEDDEKYCCELEDKQDGISTLTAILIIVGTLIGFVILFALFVLLVKSFCFKFKRSRSQNRQVRRECILLPSVTPTSPNAAQQYSIYTIPPTDNEKPPPYIPNEPTAPPSYDEVMRECSQQVDE